MGRKFYIKKEGAWLTNLIDSVFKKKVPVFPETVLLETHSGCNGLCVFCPYEDIEKNLPKGRMEQGLFSRIVDELALFNAKKIIPCFINEPLLDSTLLGKLAYIREKTPKTAISLTTNASLLTEEKIRKILDENLADEINISFQGISKAAYERSMKGLSFDKTLKNVKTLLSLRGNGPKRPVVVITTVETNIVEAELNSARAFWEGMGADFKTLPFETRSGDVTERLRMSGKEVCQMHCKRPFNTMVISFDGLVPICCVDYTRRVVLGDVNKESIHQIWNGGRFSEVRKKLTEGRAKEIPACRDCRMAQ